MTNKRKQQTAPKGSRFDIVISHPTLHTPHFTLPLQLLLELLVGELVQQVEFAVHVEHANVGVTHTVEEGGLHHGVVDHVLEDNPVAYL